MANKTVSSRQPDDWVQLLDNCRDAFNERHGLSIDRGDIISMCIHNFLPGLARDLEVPIPKSIDSSPKRKTK